MHAGRLIALAAFAALASSAGAPSPARAECYDVFGCSNRDVFRFDDLTGGPNCEFLWTMRNTIYKERGYCFNTQRGIAAFGNAGCQYDDVRAVPLNRVERQNVATIARAERAMACPR